MENAKTKTAGTFADIYSSPDYRPIDIESMTDEEIAEEIQKAYDDIENGRVRSAEEVKRELYMFIEQLWNTTE